MVKEDPDVYLENPFPKKIRDKDTMQKYMDADEKLSNSSLKIEYYTILPTLIVYRNRYLIELINQNAIEFMRFTAGLG